MPYVERDEFGNVKGRYANPQPGYAEEWLNNGHPDLVMPVPPAKIFSVREFRSRFTQQEQVAIRAAALVDHAVGLAYDEFLSAQYINLDDPAVERYVDLYIEKGLLAASRKPEILA